MQESGLEHYYSLAIPVTAIETVDLILEEIGDEQVVEISLDNNLYSIGKYKSFNEVIAARKQFIESEIFDPRVGNMGLSIEFLANTNWRLILLETPLEIMNEDEFQLLSLKLCTLNAVWNVKKSSGHFNLVPIPTVPPMVSSVPSTLLSISKSANLE